MSDHKNEDDQGMEKYAVVQNDKEKTAASKVKKDLEDAKKKAKKR